MVEEKPKEGGSSPDWHALWSYRKEVSGSIEDHVVRLLSVKEPEAALEMLLNSSESSLERQISHQGQIYFFLYAFLIYDLNLKKGLKFFSQALTQLPQVLKEASLREVVTNLQALMSTRNQKEKLVSRVMSRTLQEALFQQRLTLSQIILTAGDYASISIKLLQTLLAELKWRSLHFLMNNPVQIQDQSNQPSSPEAKTFKSYESFRSAADQSQSPSSDKNNNNCSIIIEKLIAIQFQNANLSKLSQLMVRDQQEPSLVPGTMSFLTHCFQKQLIMNETAVITALLNYKLELEASYLLQMGYKLPCDIFTASLARQCYLFAIQYYQLFLADQEVSIQQKQKLIESLLHHLEHSYEIIELIIYFLKGLSTWFNYQIKYAILKILREKLKTCNSLQNGFLFYVRNPIKVCIMLIDLNNSLKSVFFDDLRLQINDVNKQLTSLAKMLETQIQDDAKLRLILNDQDIKGRDLITIISQNSLIELFRHPYVQNLVEESWSSPFKVEKSPLVTSTSWRAVQSAFREWDEGVNPLFQSMHKAKAQLKKKAFSLQLVPFKSSIVLRFYFSLLLIFFLATFNLIYLSQITLLSIDLSEGGKDYDENQREQLKQLDGIVKFNCNETDSFDFITTDPVKLATWAGFQASEGARYNQTKNYLWMIVCHVEQITRIRLDRLVYIDYFILLAPAHYLCLLYYFIKTRKPLGMLLSDMLIFDIILIINKIWKFQINGPVDDIKNHMDQSTLSNYIDHGFLFRDTLVIELEVTALIILWLRAIFRLKSVKLLGPFLNSLIINCKHLMTWLIIFVIAIITSTYFLITILSQEITTSQGCASFKECLYILIEGSVGEVNFDQMHNDFPSQFFYSIMIILFMVIFLSILIAQMSHNYNDVNQNSELFYFKGIFDLRYFYNIDDRFGILVMFDFPLSILNALFLIPIIVFELKERYRTIKQQNKQLMASKKRSDKRIKLEYCCCCCKVKKHNTSNPHFELEDYNAILFKIYQHIFVLLASAFILAINLVMAPFGYFAIIVNHLKRLRRINKSRILKQKQNFLTGKRLTVRKQTKSEICAKQILQLTLSMMIGIPLLIIYSFIDTLYYIKFSVNEETDFSKFYRFILTDKTEYESKDLFEIEEISSKLQKQKESSDQLRRSTEDFFDKLPETVMIEQENFMYGALDEISGMKANISSKEFQKISEQFCMRSEEGDIVPVSVVSRLLRGILAMLLVQEKHKLIKKYKIPLLFRKTNYSTKLEEIELTKSYRYLSKMEIKEELFMRKKTMQVASSSGKGYGRSGTSFASAKGANKRESFKKGSSLNLDAEFDDDDSEMSSQPFTQTEHEFNQLKLSLFYRTMKKHTQTLLGHGLSEFKLSEIQDATSDYVNSIDNNDVWADIKNSLEQ